MQLNELIDKFYIYTSNEEEDLLRKMKQPCALNILTDREKFVAAVPYTHLTLPTNREV